MFKLSALIAAALLTAGAFGSAFAGGTSPGVNPDTFDPNSVGFGNPAVPPVTITFSEFPVGTPITNQYVPNGIDFSSQPAFIATDSSNPTSPVLSGEPRFTGPITGCFIHPTTLQPAVRRQFSLDAGYFNNLSSTQIAWYDLDGNLLGSTTNSVLGIEHFTTKVPLGTPGIHCWTVSTAGTEALGFAIDNVSFRGFLR